MQSLSFRTVHTGFFLFLENISNPCNSEGGSFVSRMKRQNQVYTPAATHNKKRKYIIMKKTVSVCMTAVMALSLLAGGAVQAYALSAETVEPVSAVAEENCISSSWKRASDPALTEKVRKVFDKAFEGLEGVSYTPVALLASRTTGSGIQYRILCKATVVVPGAQEEYVVVTLQRGWLGKAEILDIGDPLCLTNLDYEEGAVGTWQEAESPP